MFQQSNNNPKTSEEMMGDDNLSPTNNNKISLKSTPSATGTNLASMLRRRRTLKPTKKKVNVNGAYGKDDIARAMFYCNCLVCKE